MDLKEKLEKVARVTKIVKQIKFEGDLGRLEAENFPETTADKIFDKNSSFHVKSLIIK